MAEPVVRGKIFGRLRVGLRVEDLSSGRVLSYFRGITRLWPTRRVELFE